MKRFTPHLLVLAMPVAACGKKAAPTEVDATAKTDKATPAEPKKVEPDAAPKVEPDAAPKAEPDTATAASADTAPKAEPDAAADAGAPASDATKVVYWAPLFEVGRVTVWEVNEVVTRNEEKEDGTPGETKTTELSGKLTCTVKAVEATKLHVEGRKGEAATMSTIDCTGYNFDHGIEAGLKGVWVTDGKTLWQRYDNFDDYRFESSPKAREESSEEQVLSIKAQDKPNAWCWRLGFVMGDGGVFEVCYDDTRGPYRYFGQGGSALTESKVTVTLAP
jgi:hypothetical protein